MTSHKTPLICPGRVNFLGKQCGIEGVRIEVLDSETSEILGQAWSDSDGSFHILVKYRSIEATTDLARTVDFRIFPQPKRYVLREIKPDRHGDPYIDIVIETDDSHFPPIILETLEELYDNEKTILNRIAQIPNGGNLFLIHPFMLLSDAGVEISPELRSQLERVEPHLSTLSALPYQALKHSHSKQNVQTRVHGLFRRLS